jgi:protein N-terminal methyltransferase
MLKPNGVICIKENVSDQGFLIDRDDSSIMRNDEHFKLLFHRAGCTLQLQQQQQQFPAQLKAVNMYALT